MVSLERTAPGLPGTLARAARADAGTRVVSGWARAVAGLVLLIWLIPTQKYRLPVALPFNLEPYRLYVIVLLGALIISVLVGAARISTGGHAKPLFLLASAALASQVSNWALINAAEAQTDALKSLSYFLSFLVAFVIVCSTLRSEREIDTVIKAIVVGAFVVALGALYESRFRTNLFANLDNWIPFLDEHNVDRSNVRQGRLRVRASAHHPIPLAGALLTCVPLAVYMCRQAATSFRKGLWLTCALVMAAGAVATVSRTVVTMLAAMLIVALVIRGRALLRWWPLVIVLAGFVHYAAPASISGIYRAYTPSDGLVAEQQGREGQSGSGRIADLWPGVERAMNKPLFGHGLGLGGTTGEPPRGALTSSRDAGPRRVIYDNQWLQVLVALGIVGFVGAVWFVWGAVIKLARAARRAPGQTSDRLAALAIACTGFGVGMLTYDAFAFVQVTFLFFVIVALGLRSRTLAEP